MINKIKGNLILFGVYIIAFGLMFSNMYSTGSLPEICFSIGGIVLFFGIILKIREKTETKSRVD